MTSKQQQPLNICTLTESVTQLPSNIFLSLPSLLKEIKSHHFDKDTK